ncbi:MAG TPA: 4Fe-4S dicluster domain-containing protein [Candidatus Deferrimicrobiaceae bacterium]
MWTSRRRAAALLQGAAFLLLPFLRVRGESAFRFDIPSLRLHFFGSVLWIDEFYLFLLGLLFLALLTIAVTVVLGRVWCGWLCPQTVIAELAEWAAAALPKRLRPSAKAVILLPLSALVSLSLIGYFVPPAEAARNLFRSPVLTGFFLAQWAVVYGMVAVLGTRFCRTVCPYSMLQEGVSDRETISVAFDPSRADCLRCDLCTRVCPVGIDVRKGNQRECIACARCIDACGAVTARRELEPFIAYRGTIRRGKTYILAGATAAAALVFAAALLQKPAVAFAVQWERHAEIPGANVYRFAVRNDLPGRLDLTLSVEGMARIVGDPRVTVRPRSRATGNVIVRAEGQPPREVRFTAEGCGVRIGRRAAFP